MGVELRVTDRAGLDDLCARLADADWLALDTEFLRERTYRARLCLVQVATPDVVALVDTLADLDLEPLFDLLLDDRRTKVLHAARQDLEIFVERTGRVPTPIFDTQIAATFLGHGDQIGYGALVAAELGVELDKAHARSEWDRRPLDEAAIRYALDDVRYLRTLYPRMRDALDAAGRTDWAASEFDQLADRQAYEVSLDDAWKRVKGVQKLKGSAFAIAQRLAAWRESTAQSEDRPRRWVLADDALIELARRAPRNGKQLVRIRGIDARFVDRHGDAVVSALHAGRTASARRSGGPDRPPPRLTPHQEALADALGVALRVIAARESLSPGALATRRDLEAVVRGNPDVDVLRGWRGELVGRSLREFLAGSSALRIVDGRLELD